MILHAVEAGEGPPVALLHGLFGAARNLGSLGRRLARSFRTLALDLRNHGDSPHAADTGYGAMAADVAETLGAAGALPASVMGHSMGGKVAMRMALERPEAVEKLLVADIAPVAYRPHFRALAEAMRGIPLRPGLTRADADAALADVTPEAGLRAFLLQNLRFGSDPAWRIGLGEISDGLEAIEGWEPPPPGATYDKPTLFVAGERSAYVRLEHRPAIRALFPAARFVTLKDAGHWLHADNPDGFAAVVEGFFKAQPT